MVDLKSLNVFLNWYHVLNNINYNLNDIKNLNPRCSFIFIG